MPDLRWDEGRDIGRLQEYNRLGARSFAARTATVGRALSDPLGEVYDINFPYRRVIGAKLVRIASLVRAARR